MCGIQTDGTAYCWGSASSGALGTGITTGTFSTPQLVSGGYSFASMTIGNGFTCGVRTDGVGMCWGPASYGRLGNGATSGNYSTPVVINGGYTWKNLTAVGPWGTCGVRSDGAGLCWGDATNGHLGNGVSTGTFTSPQPISGGYTWKKIYGESGHSCGIRTDGAAMCWGISNYGQLGNNQPSATGTVYNTPVLVQGGYTWSDLALGSSYTCGIRTDGVAMCWGMDAAYGTLGNGAPVVNQGLPFLVSTSDTFTGISAKTNQVCASETNGTVLCWGNGQYGQLGNGSTTSAQTTPVAVSGGNAFSQVSAGDATTCGVRADGRAMCWGMANYGKLGNGTTSPNALVPGLVTDP